VNQDNGRKWTIPGGQCQRPGQRPLRTSADGDFVFIKHRRHGIRGWLISGRFRCFCQHHLSQTLGASANDLQCCAAL
jgi:hypothetical protein